MSKVLRGLPAQLLLVTVLPLILLVTAASFGALYVHHQSMRQLISDRDMRAVMATALVLEDAAKQHADGSMAISPTWFDAMINPMPSQARVTGFLTDATGRAIQHTNRGQVNRDLSWHAGVAEALQGKHGVTYQVDPGDGVEHVVSYAPIVTASGAYALIIEEPWEQVVDPLMRYSLAVPLLLLPVLLLTALALVLGMRRIVQPLQLLEAQARLASAGDLGALTQPVRGIDEIVELQRTLTSMAQRIEADQRRLRAYASEVTDAQERERKRLAQELHDDTIQNLVVLSQRIQAARLSTRKGTALDVAKLDDLHAQVLRMIEDVRRISRALRPIYLEEAGLAASLEKLTCEADELGRHASPPTRVSFELSGEVSRVRPEFELALYRIAQEGITNALKHARARNIRVQLQSAVNRVRLTIEDDGLGANVASGGEGFGLIGMRERALGIGANMQLSVAPTGGRQIEVTVEDVVGDSHLAHQQSEGSSGREAETLAKTGVVPQHPTPD